MTYTSLMDPANALGFEMSWSGWLLFFDLFVTSTLAIFSALAVWATKCRRRAAAVCASFGCVSAVSLIRAYELALAGLYLVLTYWTLVALVSIASRNRACDIADDSDLQWRWTLRDQLLLIMVAAWSLGLTLFCRTRVVEGRGGGAEDYVAPILLGCIFGVSAFAVTHALFPNGLRNRIARILIVPLAIPTLPLALWLAIIRNLTRGANHRRIHRLCGWLALSVVTLALLGIGLGPLIYLTWPADKSVFPELPNPNGYDYFWRAMEVTDSPYHEDDFEANRVRAVELVRQGISMNCAVPLDTSDAWLVMRRSQTASVVSSAFEVLGDAAEEDGRIDDAVSLYLDMLRFAHKSCIGNTPLWVGVSTMKGGIALEKLRELAPAMDTLQRERVSEALSAMETEWEPIELLVRRDRAWNKAWGPWQDAVADAFGEQNGTRQRICQRILEQRRDVYALQCWLAILSYEADHGKRPTKLQDLVPRYFDRVPTDPRSGQVMRIGEFADPDSLFWHP